MTVEDGNCMTCERCSTQERCGNTRATDPLLEKISEAATQLLANPEGVEEWQEMAMVLKEYGERKDAK